MNTRCEVGGNVRQFIGSLAPEPRRRVWVAIKSMQKGQGDVLQLEGKLAPFFRLRVDKIRIIFLEKSESGERVLKCFFADYRATVYRTLSQLIANNLLGELLD